MCGTYATFFSTYLYKEDTDWSMRYILEVQMLIYSKIMLGNCCIIQSSLLSSIMSCHQWVIRSPDWPDQFFLTTKLFSPVLPYLPLLASPSISNGRPNFRPCPWSHQHWTLSKFRPSGHRLQPRPNQSKWYSIRVLSTTALSSHCRAKAHAFHGYNDFDRVFISSIPLAQIRITPWLP